MLLKKASSGGVFQRGPGWPRMTSMQTIYPTSLTPEKYVEEEYHKQVRPPENCPNCQRARVLEALAYYERCITTATAMVLMIWVRRFLCRVCRVSVSCLPAFAQPYRPVNTPTIAAGFSGHNARPEVQRWSQLIDCYWRRLTGQNLSFRFDRERLWFEFHRAGFSLDDLVRFEIGRASCRERV